MNQDYRKNNDPSSLWAEWMKSATDFWQSAAKPWEFVSTPGMYSSTAEDKISGMETYWEKSLDAWKTMSAGLFDSDVLNALNGPGSVAELSSWLARALVDGGRISKEWMNCCGRIQDGGGLNFAETQREMFHAWVEFHEKEIQPLLKVPQVGLTRFYQEKVNQYIDKLNSYQAAIIDMQYLLMLPLERTLRATQEQFGSDKKENSLSDFNNFYTRWIKTLEGQYMELFKSPEWRQSLNRIIDASAGFRSSRNEILMDFLQFLPIPTNKDMDDVYKELYQLKKMVKEATKKLKDLDFGVQHEQRGMQA